MMITCISPFLFSTLVEILFSTLVETHCTFVTRSICITISLCVIWAKVDQKLSLYIIYFVKGTMNSFLECIVVAWLHHGFVIIVVVYFQVDLVFWWLLCTVRLMLYASLWSDVECGVRPGGRGEGGHSSGNRVCRKCQVFREQITVCLQHLQQATAGTQAVQAWVLWQLRLWGALCRWPSQGLQGPRLPGGARMWAGVVWGTGLATKPTHEKSGCSGAGGSRGHVRVSQRQHQRHQQPQRPVRSWGPRLGERQRQIGHNFCRHWHWCSGRARGGKPKRLGSPQWEQTKQQPIRALLVRHVQSARCGGCSQHVARWSAARKGRAYRGRGRESIAGEWWTWGCSKPRCISILSQRCRGCHSQVPTTGKKHTQGGWVPLSFLTECQVLTSGQKNSPGGWVLLFLFLTERKRYMPACGLYNLLSLLRVFSFEIQVAFREKGQFIWATLTSEILSWCWWTGFVVKFPQVCFSCCHGFFEVCTHLMPLAALLRYWDSVVLPVMLCHHSLEAQEIKCLCVLFWHTWFQAEHKVRK